MQDINNVSIIGRLVRDAELSYTQNGAACGRMSIAVNESRRNGDQWTDYANYFDVTVWGKSAENLKPYLVKGKQIAVDGHLQQQRWEKDGQKNSKVVIIADNIQLIGGARENNGAGSGGNYQQPQQRAPQQPAGYAENYGDDMGGGEFPEDIPF